MTTADLADIQKRLQVCVLAAEAIQANPDQAQENEVRAINIRKHLMRISEGLHAKHDVNAHLGSTKE